MAYHLVFATALIFFFFLQFTPNEQRIKFECFKDVQKASKKSYKHFIKVQFRLCTLNTTYLGQELTLAASTDFDYFCPGAPI